MAKFLLGIRFFTVTIGSKQYPIGPATIAHLFEPWLLKSIAIEEFTLVNTYISPWVDDYKDLADVKSRIKNNIPPKFFSSPEKKAFELDIDKARNVRELLAYYLRTFGRKSLISAFPRLPPPSADGK